MSGFSRGFGSRDTPKTFAACQKMWNDASDRKKAKGYLILGTNTELSWNEYRSTFEVRFHNNCIVEYFPEFKIINACGYSTSPTTQGRISALTGCYIAQNAGLGYHESTRVNGFPYFDGMRIDNHGHVLEEDRRPDFKTVAKKEVVQRYTNLFRRIEKLCIGRYELGEWANTDNGNLTGSEALRLLENALAEGETFLPGRIVRCILPFHATVDTSFRELLKTAKETYRGHYYKANDGYETIEVK